MRKNILFLLTLLFSAVSMAMPSTPIKEGNRIVGHVRGEHSVCFDIDIGD